ncbi:proprotein convertase P-domain-containing protein [Moritella viscosa]|uniref:proprotein convertase P-domain-containing protein n=1 Tax=Moritella viscosa TaxID=80854 RepID=UPI0039F379D5
MKKLLCIGLMVCSASVIAGEWDYPNVQSTVSSAEEALTFLQQAYPEFGDYQLRYQTESKLGHHYNFNVLINGEYQPQKAIVVSTNKDFFVSRVFKSLENTVVRNGQPTVAAELEAPRELEAIRPPVLSKGQVESVSARLFTPDLRTMDRQPAPDSPWADITEYPNVPQYLLKNTEVLKSGGKYYLSNSRVTQVDAKALVSVDPVTGKKTADNSMFLSENELMSFSSEEDLRQLSYTDDSFAQLMAFYHLDLSLRYIESLGFNIFNHPIDFDARGLSANNSTYYYGSKAAIFGIGGGSADALDADIVLHELGHGIHYQIVPDWAYGHTGAIGEGFGDYWAGSYSYRTQFEEATSSGQAFEIDTVFNWDGYFGHKKGTRSLANQDARYFENAEYRAHEYVAGELGDELWSTPLFQSLKDSVSLYQAEAFTEFDALVLESMYGLGRGLKMHDMAQNMVYVAKVMYPGKAYADILQRNFNEHGLLKSAFNIETSSKYVDPNKALIMKLSPTGRQASIQGEMILSGMKKHAFQHNKFTALEVSLPLPQSQICGKSMQLDTNLAYKFEENLATQEWNNSQTLVYGTPKLSTDIKYVDSIIPDAKGGNAGVKTFNFTLADRNAKVGEQFAVFLDIEHDKLSDLKVSLTSPHGTKVNLLEHKRSSTSGFTGYFTTEHDDVMSVFKSQLSWGTWRLEIIDYATENSGRLKSWAIGPIDSYLCAEENNNNNNNNQSSGGSTSLSLLALLLTLLAGRLSTVRKTLFTTLRK